MTSHINRQLVLVALLVGVTFAVGCLNRDLAPAEPATQSGVLEEIHQTGTTKVDILFVIDNSNSMSQEQEILANQIEVMAKALISPTEPGAPAVQDLHIGIVSTDMGTGGYRIQTCDNPNNGDNGVLQNAGRLDGCDPVYSAPDCDRAECPWLVHSTEFPDDGSDPSNPPIWNDFGCIATLGTGGCGFEQQLESSYQAILNTEAGRPNEGFLRNDSLLAIIYVTDEDDCSSPDPEMFNPSNEAYGGLNIRCGLEENQDRLYPISRYHDGFVEARGGNADRVVVAAITGVPIDGSWNPGDPIERLEELRIVDPSNPNELQKSCQTVNGDAYPPVRIAELVYAFGNNGILESICRDDWTAALVAITRKIRDKLGGVCVDRPLASTGADTCAVIETLVDDRPCPNEADTPDQSRSAGWHIDQGTVEIDGRQRRRCEILPSDYDGDGCPDGASDCDADTFGGSGVLQGWFYDTEGECQYGQVRFTTNDVTSDESDVRFECLTALCPASRQCAFRERVEGCRDDQCTPGSCGAGQVCVSHVSEEICGWSYVLDEEGNQTDVDGDGRPDTSPCSCTTCSDTVGSVCSFDPETPPAVTNIPLVGAGGCCAEGFHCENGACIADRTNGNCS